MYRSFTFALAGLVATVPLTIAGVAQKSCPCYTATTTVAPEICAQCMPTATPECFVSWAFTTTIQGPNPTCTSTPTVTVTSPCPCGMDVDVDACPTETHTKTGKFTCARGGTKETNIAGSEPSQGTDPVITDAPTTGGEGGTMSILPIEESTSTTSDGMMSILPIDV